MRILFFVFIFLISEVSFGKDARQSYQVVKDFRQAAVEAIEDAEARGWAEVGGISLQEMKASAKTVNIIYSEQIAIRHGNRGCATWVNTKDRLFSTADGNTVNLAPHIRINKKCAALKSEEMKGVAVHEVLGVTLGKDINYEISSQIISGVKVDLDRDSDKPKTGGATGVGGGGDYDDLKFKVSGLKALNSQPGNTYFGLPKNLLAKALLKATIRPASDIDKIFLFRAKGVEALDKSITYVNNTIYRNFTEEAGVFPVYIARHWLLNASDEIDLSTAELELINQSIKSVDRDQENQRLLNFLISKSDCQKNISIDLSMTPCL